MLMWDGPRAAAVRTPISVSPRTWATGVWRQKGNSEVALELRDDYALTLRGNPSVYEFTTDRQGAWDWDSADGVEITIKVTDQDPAASRFRLWLRCRLRKMSETELSGECDSENLFGFRMFSWQLEKVSSGRLEPIDPVTGSEGQSR